MIGPDLPAREVIRALYRSLLLREADEVGLAQQLQFLSEGGAIDAAIHGFLRSPEFQTRAGEIVRAYATPARRIGDAEADALEGSAPEPQAFVERVRRHPAWGGEDVLAAMDEPMPPLARAVAYRLSDPDAVAALRERHVHVAARGDARGNWLLMDEYVTSTGLWIDVHGSRGAVIALGDGSAPRGDISVRGDGAVVVLGGRRDYVQTFEVHMHGDDNLLLFGNGSTCVQASFHMEGPGRHLVVGRDCMLSAHLYITGTDNHAILDQATGQVLNPPEDVRIGPRAWIGHGATVLKGAHVGRGAVVAARALVTAPTPDHALVAGSPARVIRTGVDWAREWPSERC